MYQQRRPSSLGMRHNHHRSETNAKMPVGLDLQVRLLRRLGKNTLPEASLPEHMQASSCDKPTRILTSSKVAGNQHHQIMKSSSKPSGQSSQSTPIPLPSSHIHRTRSELQLETDQSFADEKVTAMFQRLACGMAENQIALDVILQNKSVSSKLKTQNKEMHQTDSDSLCNDDIDNLASFLRRASELCDIEGIFLIDDL